MKLLKLRFDRIEDALEDLKQGKMIIAVDDEDRENEGDLIALAELATPEVIRFMINYGRGLVCVPITESRAAELDLPLMVERNTDYHGTAFTVSVDHVLAGTGISAFDRTLTIKSLASSSVLPSEFRKPGHIFPLIGAEGGVLSRPGHTEAAIDLARLSGVYPAAVICEIINNDGSMSRVPDLFIFAEKYQLKIITIKDLIRYRLWLKGCI